MAFRAAAKYGDTWHFQWAKSAFFLSAVFLCFCPAICFGDRIETVAGRIVEGHILEETDAWVRIQTSTMGILTLRREQIKSISREEVGLEEADADRAYVRKDYYRALEQYERVKSEGTGSSEIARKIEDVRKAISRQENERYNLLFQEARELSAQRKRNESRALLQQIFDSAAPESQVASRARQAIAFEYFLESKDYRDIVRYTDATRALEQAVEADPALVIAQFELARLYRDYSNNSQKAIAQFEKAVQIARDQLEQDDPAHEQTEAFLPRQAVLTRERLGDFRFELAELYYTAGDKQKAAEAFQKLLEDSTEHLSKSKVNDVVRRLGDVLTDIDPSLQLDRAKTLEGLDIALKYNPNLAKALYLKGRIFFDEGRPAEAIAQFDQAVNRASQIGEPAPKDIYLFRARAYLHEGRLENARADLTRQLNSQDSYEVRRLLGEVLLNGMEYENALTQFNAAIEMQPSLIPALLGRAKVYRQQAIQPGVPAQRKQDLQELARLDIEKVLQTNDKYLEAILEQGRLLRDQDRSAEALVFFNHVVESFKDADESRLTLDERTILASALCERGDIQMKNLNRNVAEADFERALKIKPGFSHAYSLLGELARTVGNFEKARDYFLKAIEFAPDNPDLEVNVALCYQDLKQYREAISHFENHYQKGGSDLRVRDWIRECQAILETQPR